jgi:dynein heavy chain
MKKLEESISESLSRLVQNGNSDYNNFERRKWFETHLSQVLMIVNQVIWTETCENYLYQMNHRAEHLKSKVKRKSVHEDDEEMIEIQTYLNDYKQNLEELTSMVREDLPKDKHKTIVGLITVEVHNRDVLDSLISQGIDDVQSFFWQQQLRTYLYETTDWKNLIKVRQINSVENYGFEYYGPSSSMVITPLTEKCWITITSALYMKLGASLAGPAGTGKTESTKDLAKGLGRFCVVYNCSEQIQYQMMEKQFRGAVKQGAWICLDEFNRIYIEVLSVIAQQLLEIR